MFNRLKFIFLLTTLILYSTFCNAQSLSQKDLELKRIESSKRNKEYSKAN